jgi:hypothetical protein
MSDGYLHIAQLTDGVQVALCVLEKRRKFMRLNHLTDVSPSMARIWLENRYAETND